MSSDLIITLAILITALLLFITEKLSIDLVALLALLALGLTRVLTPQEVFSGLSDSAVITILAIFVLAHGLEVTGIADRIGAFLARSRGGEIRLTLKIMGVAAFLSLFMNNIAVASILMPGMSTVAKRANVHLPRLLMPLAFGTLLGGMATLFATTNIVANSVLRENGYVVFSVFDFARVGLPLALSGILYMTLIGRKLLPAKPSKERAEVLRQAGGDLVLMYQLGERLFRARIPHGSFLVDRRISESALRDKYGLNLVAVERDDKTILGPTPDFAFKEGDVMLLAGRLEEFRERDVEPYLEILPMREYGEEDLESASSVIVEVVLSPRSQLIGHTLKETRFRENYGMTLLAVWNAERVIRTRLSDHKLAFGDALLLQGPRDRLPILRSDPDLIVLSTEDEQVREITKKSWWSVAIFGVTVILAAMRVLPVGEVMLAGALVLVIANILTMEQAYRAIDWRIIFLVAGILPLGLAMTKTGATDLFADALTSITLPFGPMGLLLGLLVLTVVLSQAMKGAAVSAVMAPIAVQAAQQFGVDPRAVVMGVALATSMAFITPLGHPVNILIMGPSGYRFKDFFRVGLPLTVILFFLVMILLPIFWPLT
ncbi:MAG TPA: SLC13 family permease [Anaerolineales bacterium]|nr:SLC13 family permease [Anaerolineales bacterium]